MESESHSTEEDHVAVAVRLDENGVPDDAADLFERYSQRIHAYCLHVLRDRTEAEDAVQTTFLNAHRALRRGVTPRHEYAWLHTIAKNACRMQHRTRGRRAPVANVDVDTIPRSDDDGDAAELRAALGDALSRLPERQKRALLLREWYGLSPIEIAPRLGLSVPATYALLTRARRSLAGALTATVRGPLAILDLGGLADALRGLKAYVGGATAKTAVAAAVVTASVGVGGGVLVDRSLRDSPERATSRSSAASIVRPEPRHATRVAQTRHGQLRTTARPDGQHVRDATSTSRTVPAANTPTPASTPTASGQQRSQSSEPTGFGEAPTQPPPQRDDSALPAPSAPAPIESPVLPLPPLPDLPGTDDLPVPVDAAPLPPLPDPDPSPAEPLPPLPQLPLP
jgi:RNA polymerase sigma factor (sigma-70 family)